MVINHLLTGVILQVGQSFWFSHGSFRVFSGAKKSPEAMFFFLLGAMENVEPEPYSLGPLKSKTRLLDLWASPKCCKWIYS